jgi:hypothetical protein
MFVGKCQEQFGEVREGDLIAISSGLKIVALGVVASAPCPVTEMGLHFTDEDKGRFDYEDWVLGCRLSFTDLAEEDWLSCRQGTFHEIHDRADELRRIHSDLHQRFGERQEFDIRARSCTLLRNSRRSKDVLWQRGLVFKVPVYQRPYSWKEPEVRRFITDLLYAFSGANGRPKEEPMFIGTMQLGEKMLLDNTGRMQHEVIDGQQRLSTLILLLKILKDRAPKESFWAELAIESRLTTAVSSGAQQVYLNQALAANTLEEYDLAQNPYLEVMPLIASILDEGPGITEDSPEQDPQSPAPLDVPRLLSYLTSQVYFVVIETRATLSKTLQIFNSINTSGMDLNGGDVFKVRYYEYLQLTKNVGEQEFERISSIYRAVDEGNKAAGFIVCSIEGILSLAQHLLITRHKLPKELHKSAASTFFERFFDTVLGLQQWPNFTIKACKEVEISLDELKRLVGVQFEWAHQFKGLGAEARCMLEFIWWSRYGRYGYLVVLFRDRFGPDEALTERFIIQLSKLFILFSIVYWRTVAEVDQLMHQLLERICGELKGNSAEQVFEFLREAARNSKDRFTDALTTYELAANVKAKNLACRLSALRDELGVLDGRGAEDLRKLIFETEIDIEHIESWTHHNEEERKRIHKEWEGELNRIGNLMVIESGLNRSIQNSDYVTVKISAYASQKEFVIARHQARTYPQWNLEKCKERKGCEVNKLVSYLCN